MRTVVEDGDDEPLGLRADTACPAPEALGAPLGVAPMRARHVLGIGAVSPAGITALMGGDALTAVEHLDGARRDAEVDLLADQGVGHRVQEAGRLDVVVEVDPGQPPFGEGVVLRRQGTERRSLDRLEQGASGRAEPAHRVGIDTLDHRGDGGVAFGEREERLSPKPPQDVGLGQAHAGLDLGLVAGLAWPGRQDADAVMVGHHPIGAVDLWIVERGFVNGALEVVGHDEAGDAAEEAEQADMRADPVGQRLGPGRLGVGQARRAQHRHEDLGLAHDASGGIDDLDLLAGVIDEDLVAGGMVLAHHRGEPALELPVEIAEPGVAVAVWMGLPVLLPEHGQVDPGPAHLPDDAGPVRLGQAAHALLHAGPGEQALLQHRVRDLGVERPGQAGGGGSAEVVLHGRAGDAQRSPDLTRAHPVVGEPQHLFDLSHGQLSPGRHPILLVVEDWDAAVADPRGCAIADAGYRVADIKSERWPASRRNGWPASVGIRTGASPDPRRASTTDS